MHINNGKLFCSRTTRMALLTVLLVATFFVNNSVINVDIMESRNIVTAREMVYDGHWLVPTMNGEIRLEKPPLPTWLAAVAEIVAPDSVAVQRGMAGMAAVVLVVFVYLFAGRVLKVNPLLPTLLLYTCYNVILMGRTASWDIYCHAFMMGAIYFLARALLEDEHRWRRFILCGVMVGLSFMSKGPVSLYALMLPFIISFAIVYRPSLKGRAAAVTLTVVVAVAIGVWWYANIYIAHPEAMAFVAGKESGSWLNHNVRPWYYYWKFFLEAGVWSLLLLSAIIVPLFNKKLIRQKGYALSLSWTLLLVVILSLLPEKKTRYLLPMLIPASMTMAFLVQHWINVFRENAAARLDVWAFRVNTLLIAVAVVALPVGAYLFVFAKGFMSVLAFISLSLFFIAVAIVLAVAAKWLRPRLMVAAVTVLFVVAECFALPYIDVLVNNTDRHSIELTWHDTRLKPLPFYRSGSEPMRIELVYAAHKKIKPIDLKRADEVLRSLPCAVLTHGRIGEYLSNEVLSKVDTVWVGLYDDNRRPKGTRRYSKEFIYNLTVLKTKQPHSLTPPRPHDLITSRP